jgi:hypothetical protein
MTTESHEVCAEWVAKDRRTHLSHSSSSTLRKDLRICISGDQIVTMMQASEPWH